jgi:hypothetical protein
MGRLLNFGVTWDAAAKSITIAPNAGYIEESSASYMKSFGTYSTIAGWSESAALSQNDRYYYLKNGGTQTGDVSNICVESGRHRYAEADAQTFRETTYRRLLKQVANDSDAGFLSGNGGFTAKGYTLYTFTIEYENIDKTERMHYIIGDNKYILITETDYHDESAADIKLAAKTISDSFEWAR